MPQLIDDKDAEPKAIALYWNADTETWCLLGIYRDLTEARENIKRWRAKGTDNIMLYLIDEQFGYETF